jgi:hypothetical protein
MQDSEVKLAIIVALVLLAILYISKKNEQFSFWQAQAACVVFPKYQIASLSNNMTRNIGKTFSDGAGNSFKLNRFDAASAAGDNEGYIILGQDSYGWKSVANDTILLTTAGPYFGFKVSFANANQMSLVNGTIQYNLTASK